MCWQDLFHPWCWSAFCVGRAKCVLPRSGYFCLQYCPDYVILLHPFHCSTQAAISAPVSKRHQSAPCMGHEVLH